MKKILFIMVFGVFPQLTFSQSNVQIYGIADALVQFGKDKGDRSMAVQSGGLMGPRIGFRGEEDLGGNLKAIFLLEEGFNIDTGKSSGMTGLDDSSNPGSQAFTRQSYVGLKGIFGQLTLGRQYAPGYFTESYVALMRAIKLSL